MFKVLVCGGRDFGDLDSIKNDRTHPLWIQKEKEYNYILNKLTELSISYWPKTEEDQYGNWLPNVKIITGGASGVDTVAIDWAVVNWCEFAEYKADWKKHGKAAGPIRNKLMLDKEEPNVVVAFQGGSGTANMIKLAKEKNIQVIEIEKMKE